MKICIGIPSPNWVHPDFALGNLPQIIAYSKANIKNLDLTLMYKQGVMTSSNRNFILNLCLNENVDGILWLDADMLYPYDILESHLKTRKDVIGSVYFRRGPPHDPQVFKKGNNKIKPYRIIDVAMLPKNRPYKVDGMGFGGMFVKTHVYREMGEEKWMRYGENFGIPGEMEHQESHDLIFCQMAQKYGFDLYVNPAVRPVHLGEKEIELKDWQRYDSKSIDPKQRTIAVLMPTIDIKMANKAVEAMKEKAGVKADYYIIEDFERHGFVSVVNDAVNRLDYDYYVYVAQDAFPGRLWLKRAYDKMRQTDGGLFAFNDGKWNGKLASFGMVERKWMKTVYGGDLFFKGYNAHYGDTELTLIAMQENKLRYDPDAVLMEVDYKKHGVRLDDKKLFNQRKTQLFNSSYQDIFE